MSPSRADTMTKFKTSMCFYEGFHAWLRPTQKSWTSSLENAPIGQKKENYTCLDNCKARKEDVLKVVSPPMPDLINLMKRKVVDVDEVQEFTAGLSVIVIDTLEKLELLLKLRTEFESLKLIVLMDDIIHLRPALKVEAEAVNFTLKTMKEIIMMGENNKQAIALTPPNASNFATISYTSGTGGTARGVLLSHANYAASISTISGHKYLLFTTDDVLFSFLPAAHSFERMMEAMILASGGAIGFFQGNVLQLGDDLFHLRPTVVPCVPSLLNRIHNNAMTRINKNKLTQWLFQKGLASKKQLLEK
uniref:long-chain-fatty-acid--CoA ligase n=1 Tax=Romanomermis culicivorax TaxID=13658 RepID=A0A915KJF0_ROMCU